MLANLRRFMSARNSWLGFILLVLLAIGLVASMRSPLVATSEIARGSIAGAYRPVPLLQPDAGNLTQHVTALAFERVLESDRQRAREYITQTLESYGWSTELQPFEQGTNVIATQPGNDPEAGILVVGAHYDTVPESPGADDNATGVAVVLELARLLAQQEFPKTLQLVFFDREEIGLLGSFAYVANLERREKVAGAVVLDMVGYACHTAGCQRYPDGLPEKIPLRNQGDFLAAIADMEHRDLLEPLNNLSGTENMPPAIAIAIPFKGAFTPDLLRSDHAPFWLQGIGAVVLTDTANFRNPHYHKPTDTSKTLDRDFFTGSARLVTNTVVMLVNKI